MKKANPNRMESLLAGYEQNFLGLRQQLDTMTYFCKGTVLKRMMKCGQQRCACHKDPAKRHGPYFEWTFKDKGKTVNRRLSSEEAPVYQAATQQYRELHSVLKRMEKVSLKAVQRLALNSIVKKNL